MLNVSFENNNVRIENNLVEELLSDIKKLTKAGVIKIVYLEKHLKLAEDLTLVVQKAGYLVEKILFDDNIFAEELEETSEGIVLLGNGLEGKFWGEKCLILVDDLNMYDILHKKYHSIIVSENDIKSLDCATIASCYGFLMTKLIGCFDYKLSCICYGKNKDLEVVQEIEKEICELFSQSYSFNRDEKFIRDLITAIINVGQYESTLCDMNILDGYEICYKVLGGKRCDKEYAMLVGWFILNCLKCMSKSKGMDLFLPCDIMADIDYVTKLSDINKVQLVKKMDNISAKEYTRLGYISKEYSKEIDKYLDIIYSPAVNAMKNFRRIYYDAGLELSSSITIKGLAEGVLRSVSFVPNYSYLKTLRILGAV